MRPTHNDAHTRRLLIPIDARDRSEWGLRYALRRHAEGVPIAVALLAVAEPIVNLHVLRFRTERQAADFLKVRAHGLLGYAAAALRKAGISAETHFREGEVASTILDAAEQLECDEIVTAAPPRGLLAQLLFPDAANDLMRLQQRIPVVTVNEDGRPTAGGEAAASAPVHAVKF